MTELANDPGVFIRSMATRGATGGMARARRSMACDILDVAATAPSSSRPSASARMKWRSRRRPTPRSSFRPGPGRRDPGDQGRVLEIADIHVVSKCDRDDADRTLMDLKQMLDARALTQPKTNGRPR